MDDGTLRKRYRQLLERRGAEPGANSVPLETIEALADERLDGSERLEALDRVLSDPRARAEYEFLREIASARPRSAFRSRRWLIAAAVVVTVGGGLLWKAAAPGGSDPLRGSGSDVVLLGPAEGGTLSPGDRFAWRPVPGALGYTVEVLTPDGEVAFRAESTDTALVFSGPQASSAIPGPALWTVTAQMGGTAQRRSAPRKIQLGR